MRTILYYLLFSTIFLASCEDIYEPSIDVINGNLVVEAQITNNLSKNIIHLTRTRNFYDKLPPLEVTGATVSLVELGSKVLIRGYETSSGYYVLNSLPESGKQYFLRIVIQNETFESRAVTMPPTPAFQKFYTEYIIRTVYVNTPNNNLLTSDYPGRELFVDMPVSKELSYYRIKVRNLVEWSWDPTGKALLPASYGWYTFTDNQQFMLAGPKNFNSSSAIERYHLLTLSYNPFTYLFSDSLVSHGHIVMIEQYGTSKESYEFHDKLNNQFAASGSLFDPIQTQIEGNILCTTTPSKKVFGFFDLNSYQQYRYYFYLNPPPGKYVERQIFRYPDIPSTGRVDAIPRTKEEPDPVPIKPPDWWEE